MQIVPPGDSPLERGTKKSASIVPGGVGRRTFLAGSAASVVGAITLSSEGQGSALTGKALLSPVSIGYWKGSPQMLSHTLPKAIYAGVTDASGISADSAILSREGALVTIHGLFGSSICPATEMLEAQAHYAIATPEGERTVPFHFWSYRPQGSIPSMSRSARFLLPVHPEEGLRLAVTHTVRIEQPQTKTTIHTQQNDCSLSHTTDGATALLRPGIYFFALGDTRHHYTPHWNSCVFLSDSTSEGERRLYRRTLSGMKPVDFPYLILSVVPVGSDVPVML